MTVWSRVSISERETRRHRAAMCRGSDCRRKKRLEYCCSLLSSGKCPSVGSTSSRVRSTSRCWGVKISMLVALRLERSIPHREPSCSGSKVLCESRGSGHRAPGQSFSLTGLRFCFSGLGDASGLQAMRAGYEWCKGCSPLARSSSTSTSCSAAILKKALTLRLSFMVVLLVRRRDMDEGEVGS